MPITKSLTSAISEGAGAAMFRNRIINGDMRIDQRNAGSSVTGNDGVFGVDRWCIEGSQSSKFTIQQNAGSVTPPAGYTNYLGITSSSSYSSLTGDYFNIVQRIEGYNVADLDFGKSTAKTVTISFWVRSSLTGTFGGSLRNAGGNRSYPFTYTILSANTWEQKTVTITGDTTGTWPTTNGGSLHIYFNLGTGTQYSGTAGSWAAQNYVNATGCTSVLGTNGATWYITGVQLEVGSVATLFERRSFGIELALCQRYFWCSDPDNPKGSTAGVCSYYATGTDRAMGSIWFPTEMRSVPVISCYYNGTIGTVLNRMTGSTQTPTSGNNLPYPTKHGHGYWYTGGGLTSGGVYTFDVQAAAEL